MTHKYLCVFFVLILMVFQGRSQCVDYKWMMAFEHIEARPEGQVLMPLSVDFSDVYMGVGRFQLTVQFDPGVLEYLAVKNIDPSIVHVHTSTDEPGQLKITWYDGIANQTQPLKLVGNAFDLEFFFTGGESVVSISESVVQDVWTNTWPGQIFPGSIVSLPLFEVLLLSEPDHIGADLTGGGTHYPGDTVDIYADEPFNYRFIEWRREGAQGLFDDPLSASTFFIMPDRHIQVTAYYEVIVENPLFLTIETEGSGSVLVGGVLTSDTMFVVSAGQSVVLEAIAEENWAFAKWSGDASGVRPRTSIRMNTDKEVTAHFSELFPLALYVSPDTLAVDLMGAGWYRENQRVSVSASPMEDYVFSGWTGEAEDLALLRDSLSLSTTFTMPARPVALTANYEPGLPDYYSLGLLADPDTIGAVLSQSETGPFQEGTRVGITASQVDGYDFKGWVNREDGDLSFVDDPLQAETFLVMPAAHVTLTATYEEIPPPEQFVLSVSIVGNGTVYVNDVEYVNPVIVDEGTVLTLEAMADEAWQFDGWKGDAEGADALLHLSMDIDRHVTATFTEKPPPVYTLEIYIAGDGMVGVEEDILIEDDFFAISFVENTEVALRAYPTEGWAFSGWSGDLESLDWEVMLVMDADRTLTATFEKIPEPPVYMVSFAVTDHLDNAIDNAFITFQGSAFSEGEYVFEGLLPDTYTYVVSRDGYFSTSGELEVVDEDVAVTVVLYPDDTQVQPTQKTGFSNPIAYPNPVRNTLTLQFHEAVESGFIGLIMVDLRGREIEVAYRLSANKVFVDCVDLSPGVYVLQVKHSFGTHAVLINKQ